MTLNQIYQAYFQHQPIIEIEEHQPDEIEFFNAGMPVADNSGWRPTLNTLKTPARFGFLNGAYTTHAQDNFNFEDHDDDDNVFVNMINEQSPELAEQLLVNILCDQPGAEWKFYGFDIDRSMFCQLSLNFIKNDPSVIQDYRAPSHNRPDQLACEWWYKNRHASIDIATCLDNFQALVEFGENRVYLIEHTYIECDDLFLTIVTEIIDGQKTRRFQGSYQDYCPVVESKAWQVTYYAPAE